MYKIAIVEFNHFHGEFILSLVYFLKQLGHEVTVYLHPQNHWFSWLESNDVIVKKANNLSTIIGQLTSYDKIIFDTIEIVLQKNQIPPYLKHKCFGIIHSTNALEGNETIRKMHEDNRIMMLRNGILWHNKELPYFIPCYFGEHTHTHTHAVKIYFGLTPNISP